MAETFKNAGSADVVVALCDAIHENKDELSKIDGATGDGDHGINMNKGFTMAKERIEDGDKFSDALETLGDVLVEEIGGSMGPIYGTFFITLADELADEDDIDAKTFGAALDEAADALVDLTGAQPGDKTLVDTITPAKAAYAEAQEAGKSFAECLEAMSAAAETGWQSTKDMQAKLGRAARLGERSIGFLDAGATSCCIILQTMAKEIGAKLV